VEALVGHRVRVRVQARVERAPAPHEVAPDPSGAFPVRAEQLFGRDFRHQERAVDVGGLDSRGPRDPILEEPRPRAVHLQAIHHVPLLERPGRRIEAGRVDGHEPRVPAVVQPNLLERLTLDYERAEVAMQYGAAPVFQTYGEHEDGGPVGHGDTERLERSGHPGGVGHVTSRVELNTPRAYIVP